MFNEYEIVMIVRPDVDDAVTEATVAKIEGIVTESGGHLLDRDDWGKRKLAFPIQKHVKGHYFVLLALLGAEVVYEIERRMRYDDSVLRFLTVKQAERVDVETRLEEVRELVEERKRSGGRRHDDDDDDDDRDEDTSESANS